MVNAVGGTNGRNADASAVSRFDPTCSGGNRVPIHPQPLHFTTTASIPLLQMQKDNSNVPHSTYINPPSGGPDRSKEITAVGALHPVSVHPRTINEPELRGDSALSMMPRTLSQVLKNGQSVETPTARGAIRRSFSTGAQTDARLKIPAYLGTLYPISQVPPSIGMSHQGDVHFHCLSKDLPGCSYGSLDSSSDYFSVDGCVLESSILKNGQVWRSIHDSAFEQGCSDSHKNNSKVQKGAPVILHIVCDDNSGQIEGTGFCGDKNSETVTDECVREQIAAYLHQEDADRSDACGHKTNALEQSWQVRHALGTSASNINNQEHGKTSPSKSTTSYETHSTVSQYCSRSDTRKAASDVGNSCATPVTIDSDCAASEPWDTFRSSHQDHLLDSDSEASVVSHKSIPVQGLLGADDKRALGLSCIDDFMLASGLHMNGLIMRSCVVSPHQQLEREGDEQVPQTSAKQCRALSESPPSASELPSPSWDLNRFEISAYMDTFNRPRRRENSLKSFLPCSTDKSGATEAGGKVSISCQDLGSDSIAGPFSLSHWCVNGKETKRSEPRAQSFKFLMIEPGDVETGVVDNCTSCNASNGENNKVLPCPLVQSNSSLSDGNDLTGLPHSCSDVEMYMHQYDRTIERLSKPIPVAASPELVATNAFRKSQDESRQRCRKQSEQGGGVQVDGEPLTNEIPVLTKPEIQQMTKVDSPERSGEHGSSECELGVRAPCDCNSNAVATPTDLAERIWSALMLCNRAPVLWRDGVPGANRGRGV